MIFYYVREPSFEQRTMAASQPSSHGRPSGLSAPRHEQITARSLAPRLRTSRGASCGAGSHGFNPSKDLQQQLPEPRAAGSGGHVNLCHRNASEAAEPRRQSEFRANAVPFRQRTGSIAHASNSYDHETISMSFLRCSTAFAAAAPGDEEIRLVARTAGEGREKKSRPNSARQSWSARRMRLRRRPLVQVLHLSMEADHAALATLATGCAAIHAKQSEKAFVLPTALNMRQQMALFSSFGSFSQL